VSPAGTVDPGASSGSTVPAMQGERRRWETVAAAAEFPVAAIAAGATGKPNLCGWSGDDEAPMSLTLEYEVCGLALTSYGAPMWGPDFFTACPDLRTFVEESYGGRWWARNSEPLDFSGMEPVETTFTRTEKGYTEFRVYESPPEEDVIRDREIRMRAAAEAEHRIVEVPLGSSTVRATVVGDAEMWSAGFGATVEGGELVVLVTGGDRVGIDSLRLEVVDDLLAACLESGKEGPSSKVRS